VESLKKLVHQQPAHQNTQLNSTVTPKAAVAAPQAALPAPGLQPQVSAVEEPQAPSTESRGWEFSVSWALALVLGGVGVWFFLFRKIPRK
jgi:hypothetical protein